VTTPFQTVLHRLEEMGLDPHRNGVGYKSCCPSHEDDNPSLTVSEGDNGTALLTCHAHCDFKSIVKAMGFEEKDMFATDPTSKPAPSTRKAKAKKGDGWTTSDEVIEYLVWRLTEDDKKRTKKKGKATAGARWEYNPDFFMQRMNFANEDKEFRPVFRVNGRWQLTVPPGKRPLYHLGELVAAPTVWVLEGEKCADLAKGLGLIATTSSNGAKSPFKSDWAPLAGKTVYIIPDHDQAGEKYADDVARILAGLEPKPSVKIVRLPLATEGHDIDEWLEHVVPDMWGDVECRAELERLAAEAPEWVPQSEPTAGTGNRPEIVITTEEHEVNAEVLAALQHDPDLYRFGYMLATVITDPDPPRGVEYPDGPSPQINPLEPAILREHMTRAARFFKLKVKGDTEEMVPAHPPEFTINAIHKRKVYPGIRPIEGVIEAPTLRPDGSILSAAGYDPATRLYLQPSVEIEPIPDKPSRQEAEQALSLIYDLVSDFPWMNDIHKAVWLCGLLTVLGRASFMGPAPLFAFDGNVPGAGKTKLADLIAIIASGRRMPRSTWPGGENADEEVRKRITSLVVQGERFVLLDNVDCELGGAPLDAAMTGDTWKDRLLGTNTDIVMPLKMVWFASANNMEFRGDFVRRVMVSRLETTLEKPEERTGFKYPELVEHVIENRGRILRAALMVLRAHRANGRPKLVDPLGSFEKWTHAIVDPVRWVTGLNPFEVRSDVRVADRGTQTRAALVEGWAELDGGIIGGVTVADALRQLRVDDDNVRKNGATPHFQVLRNAFAELTERGDYPSAKSIGRYLSRMRGRTVGKQVLHGVEIRSGVYAWKVKDATST
jgi:hypothetical protein